MKLYKTLYSVLETEGFNMDINNLTKSLLTTIDLIHKNNISHNDLKP